MKGSVLITLVALLLPGSASAQQSVEVLSVINGQQLLIELDGDGRSLRLACLQAPRPSQQPWADQAAAALNRLVQRGDRGSFDLRARDVYGRLVGRLEVGGEMSVPPWWKRVRCSPGTASSVTVMIWGMSDWLSRPGVKDVGSGRFAVV